MPDPVTDIGLLEGISAGTGEILGGGAAAGIGAGEAAAGGAALADGSSFIAGSQPAILDTGAMSVPVGTGTVAGGGDLASTLTGGAAAGGAAGAVTGGGGGADPASPTAGTGGTSFISAANPTMALTTDTANALGIGTGSAFDASGIGTGIDAGTFSSDAGLSSIGVPASEAGFVPGQDTSIWTGAQPTDVPDPMADQTLTPDGGGFDPTKAPPGALGNIKKTLNELGLSPATAAMLGISGAQALSKPSIPSASKALEGTAGPGAAAASSVIQSGGTSSPAWATQKASIDANIDQAIQEQTQAMVQQAINSGQGADSQVVQQQVNKLKNQLETQRQTMYAQAQQQNVQAAISQLGISDQALAQVANAQFKGSEEAKSAASQTASNALMLQALSKQQQPAAAPGG